MMWKKLTEIAIGGSLRQFTPQKGTLGDQVSDLCMQLASYPEVGSTYVDDAPTG